MRQGVSVTPNTVRRTGEQTKAELCRIAADKFRLHGYSGVTLEDIGHEVGITRAAVLHYFGTKAEMLGATVRPFMDALDDLLSPDPPLEWSIEGLTIRGKGVLNWENSGR